MITQRRQIVKHDSTSSFIYILQNPPPEASLQRAYFRCFANLIFRGLSARFFSHKLGKPDLLSICTATPPMPLILCPSPPNTALFWVIISLGKFGLPNLCISLHFVNIYPSPCFLIYIGKVHNFFTKFSTPQHCAQKSLKSPLIWIYFHIMAGFCTPSPSPPPKSDFFSPKVKKLDRDL